MGLNDFDERLITFSLSALSRIGVFYLDYAIAPAGYGRNMDWFHNDVLGYNYMWFFLTRLNISDELLLDGRRWHY